MLLRLHKLVANRRYCRLGWAVPRGANLLLGVSALPVLDPKGQIGADERTIILFATSLMLIVVVPVISMAIAFAWTYRASNSRATYAPDWAHSTRLELVTWLVPCAIIAALATVTWVSSHRLDPFKPIASAARPITIDVVALDWKWLFIYPDLNIATVNEVAFPANVPVDFKVTSGSVMNSFFIPQLGSQIYAMAGMETKLSLIANQVGSYDGISANYSGAGFSDMKFKALAMTRAGFDRWAARVRHSPQALDEKAYDAVAHPSRNAPVAHFSAVGPHLFHDVVHERLVARGHHGLAAAKG